MKKSIKVLTIILVSRNEDIRNNFMAIGLIF